MKKIIAIYFSDSEPMGYPFQKSQYLERYQEIMIDLEDNDIDVYIVRGDSYILDGKFKKGWRFVNGILEESDGEIQADLIFNRDHLNTIPRITDCQIINQVEFDELCIDKIKTHEAFPDISPKTGYIHSYQAFIEQIQEWGMEADDIIVLKKNFLLEGRGVFILPIKEVTKDLYKDWDDILIQEFLDSSAGIPGIVEGIHDLRVTVVNGKAINSFVRTPKEGSYVANIARGGSGMALEIEKVPSEVIALISKIDKKINTYFPAIYSADFIYSGKEYKLLELNSRPGVQHRDWSKTYKKFHDALIDMLVEAVKK
ncbi:MAG: hypothetical protein HOE80_03575 [Candidatus Magasanikbacteria bacterium]|jgi:glutathione synthase/RimK-type ligase-like ATP-grasp enzyme|nr:hypothetical protein [Candidatus Magasanikbacteria bacterium]MBT4071776.1 hypothetical protein [Candidatus Magasanikbacteria bacterium]